MAVFWWSVGWKCGYGFIFLLSSAKVDNENENDSPCQSVITRNDGARVGFTIQADT